MENLKQLPSLKVSTGWISIEVLGEPDVLLTFKGYAPVLPVKNVRTGLDYNLYISAKSLAEDLETFRQDNGGGFTGLKLEVKKEGVEKFSKYEIRLLNA